MKLRRLQGIAENALRSEIWTPEPIGDDPYYWARPKAASTVDLLRRTITPAAHHDDVERFYLTMSDWFHVALAKEGIPLDAIDKAIIEITPGAKRCVITAGDKAFTATRPF